MKATRLGEITLNKSWSSRLGVCHEASSLSQEKPPAKKAQQGKAGQMILGRQRHVKRSKEEFLDIGTSNEDLKDGNPCPNTQSDVLKSAGKMTFWKIYGARTYTIGRL